MSDTTTYDPAKQGAARAFGTPPRHDDAKPADKPATPPAPKEPDIKERASGLLASMTDAHRHNAPITPLMLTELAAVTGHVTGQKVAAPLHNMRDARGLPDNFVFKKPDGSLMMVDSAEEALAYVRSLPADVQKRPHWVVVDKDLVDATGSVADADVSPAMRQFKWAVSEDARLNPRAAPKIADKPGDDTAKKTDANMESQRQAQAKAEYERRVQALGPAPNGKPASSGTADATMPAEPGPGGVKV